MTPTVWSLLERVFGRGGVLAYHGVGSAPHSPVMHVSPARLREQLEFIRLRYTVVPLQELVQRWRSNRSTDTLVAITFDDAYAGLLRDALPLLQAFDMPATVFVTTRHAELGAEYWWDLAERGRLAAEHGTWTTHPSMVGLGPLPADNPASMATVRDRVLARFAGRWPDEIRRSQEAAWRSLRFDEIHELARDSRISLGVHTLTHPSLPTLSHAEQVTEMRDNFRDLQERFRQVDAIVAYPYGLYDAGTIRAARDAGMVAGVTMEGRAAGSRPNPFTLPRVGVGELHGEKSLSRRLNWAMRPVLVLRNRGAHPTVPRDEP